MTTPKLVIDGHLTVPLFHGTSTLFQNSIVEKGLGGRSLARELRLDAVIAEMLKHEAQLRSIPDCDWEFEKELLLRVARGVSLQNPSGHTGFNFRYGGVYLTPSKQTASRYALLNEYGSEALTGTLKILNLLLVSAPELAANQMFSDLLRLKQKSRTPIVVEAPRVPVAALQSEQGGSCEHPLEFIESLLDEDPAVFDVIVQQCNFELLSPIPSSQLRFYRIITPKTGHESMEGLELAAI